MDIEENKTCHFVKGLRVELQRALAPFPPIGFASIVEVATRTEWADQAFIQRKMATSPAIPSYKHIGKEPWKPRDAKKPQNEFKMEGSSYLNPIFGGIHEVCIYCGCSGHFAETCFWKLKLCYQCKKPGHRMENCSMLPQALAESFSRAG